MHEFFFQKRNEHIATAVENRANFEKKQPQCPQGRRAYQSPLTRQHRHAGTRHRREHSHAPSVV